MYPFICSSDKEPAPEVITRCIAPHLPSRLLFLAHSWNQGMKTKRQKDKKTKRQKTKKTKRQKDKKTKRQKK